MNDKYLNITLALAGMIQSVSLIREIAQTGKMDEAAFQASIYSILKTDPKNMMEVYGESSNIKYGLEKLIQLFNITAKKPRYQMRYMVSLIHLQKKISRSTKVLNVLTERLNQIKKQADYFHLTHPTVISNLADAYLNAIRTYRFRIIIWGSQRILIASSNMDKIRALLLAGIRSVVLWRQVGGSRLQLLFARAKIKNAAEQLLAEIEKKETL